MIWALGVEVFDWLSEWLKNWAALWPVKYLWNYWQSCVVFAESPSAFWEIYALKYSQEFNHFIWSYILFFRNLLAKPLATLALICQLSGPSCDWHFPSTFSLSIQHSLAAPSLLLVLNYSPAHIPHHPALAKLHLWPVTLFARCQLSVQHLWFCSHPTSPIYVAMHLFTDTTSCLHLEPKPHDSHSESDQTSYICSLTHNLSCSHLQL